ncbi:MAG: hypothetical protein ABL949_05975 [Fimbriimonadaceae bacterium]
MVSVLVAAIALSPVSVSGTLVTGKLAGQPVRFDHSTLKKLGQAKASQGGKVMDRADQYILSLAVGNDFMPDQHLEVWFQIEPGQSVSNRSFVFKPFPFGSDEWRDQLYGKREGTAVPRGITTVFAFDNRKGVDFTASHQDKFTATLKFGKAVKGKISGTVSVSLPDKATTKIAGSFEAAITALP